MDARDWVMLAVGMVAGGLATLAASAVRDTAFDAVYALRCWWLRVLDVTYRVLAWCGLLLLCGLAGWAVVGLLIPRLVSG